MATQRDVDDYLNAMRLAGTDIMRLHRDWHANMNRTGTQFLTFHRSLLANFSAWLSVNRRTPRTAWIPSQQQINPQFRRSYTISRNTLEQPPSTLRNIFRNRENLGWFINNGNTRSNIVGIHGIVHSSLSNVDPRFATTNSAPRSILFWNWHSWIDNAWIRSGL